MIPTVSHAAARVADAKRLEDEAHRALTLADREWSELAATDLPLDAALAAVDAAQDAYLTACDATDAAQDDLERAIAAEERERV